ncbi:MAG: HU family DNA-binding protein [Mycoplasmataceae bacterium]|jgi:nucleoid DNA-binding protein|nr:HU family DNA-binding protein [Mycoplasmataceae bacterium]
MSSKKLDLIKEIAYANGISIAKVKKIFNELENKVSDELIKNKAAKLLDFGTFKIAEQKACKKVFKGKEYKVPAKKVIKFKISNRYSKLQSKVNKI